MKTATTRNILILDSPKLWRSYKSCIEDSFDCSLTALWDSREAEDYMAATHPDLIIIDPMSVGLSQIESSITPDRINFLKKYRGRHNNGAIIPAGIISALSPNEILKLGLKPKRDYDFYLRKSGKNNDYFDNPAFFREIQQYLRITQKA